MASGWDEVYTAVHPRVGNPLLPVNVDFLLQVLLVLVVDELHDGLPAAERERNMGLWVCVRDLDHPEPPAWPGRVKQSPPSQGHSASYRIPENKRNKTHSHGECFSSCKLPFIQQLQAAGKSQTSRVHRLATPRTAGGGDLLAGLDKQVPKNSFLLSSQTQLLSRAGPGASFGSLHGVMAQEQEQHQTAQAQPSS